jgi:hypothetical protein
MDAPCRCFSAFAGRCGLQVHRGRTHRAAVAGQRGRPQEPSRTLRHWAGSHGGCAWVGRVSPGQTAFTMTGVTAILRRACSSEHSTAALLIPYLAAAPPRNARAKTGSA